jgi:biotin-dependent carboxylase-like uncharacterized protein
VRADRPAFEVLAPGPLTLVEDAGRPGLAHLGVPSSGAADRVAYAAANRLVGNRPGAAVLEVLLGGLVLRATGTVLVAVTGAPSTATIDRSAGVERRRGHPMTSEQPSGCSFALSAGETLAITAPDRGLRNYLAVRGGFDVEPVLGSRSADLLSGLGPPPLQAGDLLPVGDELESWPAAESIPPAPLMPTPPGRSDPVTLRLLRGPRDDWFSDAGWATLTEGTWRVGQDSNRVGVRIVGGTPLHRVPGFDGELPSEGMVAGAVQVPPDGQPVLFLRDHPVTGGYPVIGVLTAASVDALAQLRPGDGLRLQPKSIAASS